MPSSGVQTCALRSEEHTSELQSHDNLVCRLLLENNTGHLPRHRPRAPAPTTAPSQPPPPAPLAPRGALRRSRSAASTPSPARSIFFLKNGRPPKFSPLPPPGPLPH